MDHLDADTLAALFDGRLVPADRDRAYGHVDQCPSCREELSALAAVATAPDAAAIRSSPEAVLAAAARGDRRRRIAIAIAIVAVVAAAALAVVARAWWRAGDPIAESCARGERAFADIRASTGLVALDEYSAAWLTAWRAVCAGSDAASRRRARCLERQRVQLAELLKILASAEPASDALAGLSSPGTCADADPANAGLAANLDRATVLDGTGRHADARALASDALSRLDGDASPAASRERARALLIVADDERTLFEALRAAEQGSDDLLIAHAWLAIAIASAARQQCEVAESNARAADAALAHLPAETAAPLRARFDRAYRDAGCSRASR